VSLTSRRRNKNSSSSDDPKASIVGLSGWLFADLLLALAVVFLVASDKPSKSSIGTDSFNVTVQFSKEKEFQAVNKIDLPSNKSVDIWMKFSEPIDAESLNTDELQLEPDGEWSARFVDKKKSGAQEVFQVRLNPEKVKSTKFSVSIEKGAAISASGKSEYNDNASLEISVTICQSLTGIAVGKPDTARFVVPGGASMNEQALQSWLASPERENDRDHLKGTSDEGYGTAKLVYESLQNKTQVSQVGFAILFGGFDQNSEKTVNGVARAQSMSGVVREVLRNLGLFPSNLSSSIGCVAQEIPVRTFGDQSVGKNDLKFELYFYENR
jgi:hypothetical protein